MSARLGHAQPAGGLSARPADERGRERLALQGSERACGLFELRQQVVGERSVGALVAAGSPLAGACGPVGPGGLVQRPVPDARGGGQGGGDLGCDAEPGYAFCAAGAEIFFRRFLRAVWWDLSPLLKSLRGGKTSRREAGRARDSPMPPEEAGVRERSIRALALRPERELARVRWWRLFAAVNSPRPRFPVVVSLGGVHLLVGRWFASGVSDPA